MDVGINNHLRKISSELFIKYDSSERMKIDTSVKTIIERLGDYFDDEIDEAILFGSYERDTILPRRFDDYSDIDILVLFNTEDYEKLKPESYRNKLKKFVDAYYPRSISARDHPSIVLVLNHIKFDLVPSIFDVGFIYDSIEIPDKRGAWMETKPHKFSDRLTKKNKKYNSIVKPIIRLLKYWNASYSYPYSSYELEMQIADMDFHEDNIESGFLYAINELSYPSSLPDKYVKRIDALKKNCDWIEEYLKRKHIDKAKKAVARILPNTY